jgi:hypothetical protein
MAASGRAATRGRTTGSTAGEPYQEILAITVDLTWLLLGAIGPMQPIGIIFDTVIAWIGDAGSTSGALDSAGTRFVVRPQPTATVATTAVAGIPAAGVAEGARKNLDGENANRTFRNTVVGGRSAGLASVLWR